MFHTLRNLFLSSLRRQLMAGMAVVVAIILTVLVWDWPCASTTRSAITDCP